MRFQVGDDRVFVNTDSPSRVVIQALRDRDHGIPAAVLINDVVHNSSWEDDPENGG